MSTSALPGPLRRFAVQLDELRSGDVPDMEQAARILAELAVDEEFFGPLVAEIPPPRPVTGGSSGPSVPPAGARPPAGRGDGITHSHRCWVGIASVRGVETHRRWNVVRHQDGRAELRLADERALHRGDVATLVPPRDVSNRSGSRATSQTTRRRSLGAWTGSWTGAQAGRPG